MTQEQDVNGNGKRRALLSKPPFRLMVSLSLPAIVGMVVIGLYTFVDAIYAGQLLGVNAMVSPASVLGLFITDPALIEMGIGDFRVFLCLYVTYGLMIMAITYMQSIGDGGKAALLTIARSIILFIPLVLVIPQVTGLGIHGVWLACMLSDGIVMILSVAMMLISAARLGKRSARSLE